MRPLLHTELILGIPHSELSILPKLMISTDAWNFCTVLPTRNEKSSSLPISMIENDLKESVSESYDKSVTSNATDEAEEESFYGSGREQLKDLELQN